MLGRHPSRFGCPIKSPLRLAPTQYSSTPTRSRIGLLRWAIVLIGLWVASVAGVRAAAVSVSVVDDQGSALSEVLVQLYVIGDDGNRLLGRHSSFSQKTDAAGAAQFGNVPNGRWAVSARSLRTDRQFLKPEDNPHAAPPRFTVDDTTGPLTLELVLQRGIDVCTRFDVEGFTNDRRASIYLNESETGKRIRRIQESNTDECRPVFGGRWEIVLEPPRGPMLVGLDINGQDSPGAIAVLDLRPGDPEQFVTWKLAAPAKLDGVVRFDGERAGVSIRADLIEAGPWAEEVRERGGSMITPVYTGPDRSGYYSMLLADGVWRIRPQAKGLESAEPESVELTFAPGDHKSQDFDVRVTSGERGNGIKVTVSRPEDRYRQSVAGAVVELWPLDPAMRADRPLMRKHVPSYGWVFLAPVEPGSYVVAAAHPDYLEVKQELPNFAPQEDEYEKVSLQLDRAGRLDVLFEDDDGTPSGGWIQLDRVSEAQPDEYLVKQQSIEQARQQRQGEVDAAWRGRIAGVRPGSYKLSGGFQESFIEFELDGDWQRNPELTFAAQEQLEMKGREIPAAALAASFVCKDGEALPTVGEIGILPENLRPDEPFDSDWTALSESSVTKLSLQGKQRDSLRHGPLEESASLVAYLPATFDRWTWIGSTEDALQAEPVSLELGKVAELGSVRIECGPAIRVRVAAADGGSLPTLEETRAEEGLIVEGTVQPQVGEPVEITRMRVEPYPSVVMLRDFLEGQIDAQLWIGHPYFLPNYWEGVPVRGELVRGQTLDIKATVAAIGGAVEVKFADDAASWVVATPEDWVEAPSDPAARQHGGQDPAGRVQGSEKPEHWTVPVELRTAWISNLAPGRWQIALCADEACATQIATHPVEILRADTTRLDLRP